MRAPVITPPPPELAARENAHINATLARLALVREAADDITLAPVLKEATLPLWEEGLDALESDKSDAEDAQEQAIDDLNEEREKRQDAEKRARKLADALEALLSMPDDKGARGEAVKLLGGAHKFLPHRRAGKMGLCLHCERPERSILHT